MGNRKATKAISLVLISSIAVFFGFKSCYEADEDWSLATTQPSGGGGASHGGHYYWGSSRGYSGSRSSGSHFSGGTSRGGFGSSGHFAGS